MAHRPHTALVRDRAVPRDDDVNGQAKHVVACPRSRFGLTSKGRDAAVDLDAENADEEE